MKVLFKVLRLTYFIDIIQYTFVYAHFARYVHFD